MNDNKEKIEEVERRVGRIEERIKPKRAKTYGDPIVELSEN